MKPYQQRALNHPALIGAQCIDMPALRNPDGSTTLVSVNNGYE